MGHRMHLERELWSPWLLPVPVLAERAACAGTTGRPVASLVPSSCATSLLKGAAEILNNPPDDLLKLDRIRTFPHLTHTFLIDTFYFGSRRLAHH